jgi:hypothetical protein
LIYAMLRDVLSSEPLSDSRESEVPHFRFQTYDCSL